MKRILIIKFWALGDILMATPLLRALKTQWPDCHISWLVDDGYADILADVSLVDDVLPLDARTWRRHYEHGRFGAYWRLSRGLRRDLRARRFDIVINLMAEKWWTLWFTVAPTRIGLFPGERHGPLARFYDHALTRDRESLRHNTRHYLRPAGALGIPGPYDERMALGVSPEQRDAALGFLRDQSGYDPRKPLLLLHPGTSQPSKCWPPDYYAAVAGALGARFNVVITGSAGEMTLADAVLAALPSGSPRPLIATGRLDGIRQTAALVAESGAVFTGDTSVLHIASALGTPVVGVYGSTRPGDNAPLFGRHALLYDDEVPCAPCYRAHCPLAGADRLRCQRAVKPARALAALHDLLESAEAHQEPRRA